MSLRARFLLSLLAVLLLMAVPALFAVTRVNALRDIVIELRGQAAQSALAVGRLEAALVQAAHHQRVYVATAEAEYAALTRAAMQDAGTEIATLRDAGHDDVLTTTTLRFESVAESNRLIEGLVEAGRLDEATAYVLTDAKPELDRARASLPALAAAIDEKTNRRVAAAHRIAIAAAATTTAAVVIAFGLAGALALAAAGVLTQPLDRLRRAMARVADGTFEAPVDLPYERSDEVGDLSRSFRTMTLRLAELERLKAEFVGTASHDLKTPISIISGYAELIRDELSGPLHKRPRELLKSLSEQTETLQRRVDQLLELSRMEAGRVRLGLEEINVRHFAGELQRSFQAAARKRDLQLVIDVHENVPPFLIGDPDVLRTDVLGNLVGNALKFTSPGGTIRISMRPDGDRVSIEVADTGCGIAQDQLDHVFEKYYQGRGANAGAGLGLPIAKAGVEAHGGTIHVTSRVERGTRCRISLPVRAIMPAPLPQRAAVG
ncbi:MAG TPA: HAMP domain-containing sensor histidine kinase [Longimicrobiales bacterium]|nr:HAMP domain-containing sensor histidine kinase [Longimicrobiales bacterium]